MNEIEFLTPTVLLLGLGFVVIFACRLMHISPIVGFLIAGLAVGPHATGLIEETSMTHMLAELGVVFLLFDIGLHFSTKSAWKLRRDLLGLAPLQMLLTGVIIASCLKYIFGLPGEMALLAGFALSLSSTAVVMQLIADLRQTESPIGQTAKATLIFQDIIAIFLLIFADTVGTQADLPPLVLAAVFKTGLAFAAAILIGQYVLSPLLKLITKYNDPEMFTVLGLAIVLATTITTEHMGLSLTLGAFLAGMVLAETPFRLLLQTELRPFRSLLMAFFFITVGMMLDPVVIMNNIGVITGLVLFLISIKAAILVALLFLARRPAHHALQICFLLAQGSEFAFVIFTMANVNAGLGTLLSQQLIAAVAISMLLTPFISAMAYRWSLQICSKLGGITNLNEAQSATKTAHAPVIIVGMNEVGKTLARAMRFHSVPYIAIEHDRQKFLEATAAGYIVAYGHASDLRIWSMLNVRDTKAMCISAPRYDISKQMTPVIRKMYPNLKSYVAVSDSDEAQKFSALGAIPFPRNGAPPGLEMACFILAQFGLPSTQIEQWQEDEQSSYLEVMHDPLSDTEEKHIDEIDDEDYYGDHTSPTGFPSH
jgi:Kef-type K+ transport system membrane component KefB